MGGRENFFTMGGRDYFFFGLDRHRGVFFVGILVVGDVYVWVPLSPPMCCVNIRLCMTVCVHIYVHARVCISLR